MPLITYGVRHNWYESFNFTINRPQGMPYGMPIYTFLHFLSNFDFLYHGEKIIVPKFSFILFDEHTPQWFHSAIPSRHDWFHATSEIRQIYESVGLQTNRLYHLTDGRFITNLTFEIEAEYYSNRKYKMELCDLKVQELLIFLSRNIHSDEINPLINQATVVALTKLRTTITEQYFKHWDIKTMASLINFSPSYLHKVYHSYFGISPYNDLILIRIQHAKNLLSETQLPIVKIASDVGYNNLNHFIRQFKSFTGVSPSLYRKMYYKK
ncbi:MAG: helix-turn-helix transcriptional regulator [Bacteroidetes bacterium]|jgi:AraC family transcriptional regulator of arabinose operon|nr:helix-turn-helix transcriptional regulator [Bacteroidota bacterium]